MGSMRPDRQAETMKRLHSARLLAADAMLSYVKQQTPAAKDVLRRASWYFCNAEEFAAINHSLHYAEYPQREFDFLWKKLIESTDHNHDGQGGQIGDDRKKSYSELAIIRGGEILRDMLRNIAERVEIPVAGGRPIVVFNSLGWKRDDVVNAPVLRPRLSIR